MNKKNNKHIKRISKQRGVIIVIALFIIALIATMAYAMMSRLARDTYRESLLLHDTQATRYADGSLFWTIDQLRNDWERKNPNQLIDKFPMQAPIKNIHGYQISSTIDDMQSRFNINNLIKPDAQNGFNHLLKTVAPQVSIEKMNALTQAIVFWISPNAPDPGHTNEYYLQLPNPYRAPHKLMSNVSELRLIKGMTPQLFNQLKPYVAALPGETLLNIQTAKAPTLLTLNDTLTLAKANAFIQERQQTPVIDATQIQTMNSLKDQQIPTDKFTVQSNYFLLTTQVSIESQHLIFYTLLQRITNNSNNRAEIAIIWQSKGID